MCVRLFVLTMCWNNVAFAIRITGNVPAISENKIALKKLLQNTDVHVGIFSKLYAQPHNSRVRTLSAPESSPTRQADWIW